MKISECLFENEDRDIGIFASWTSTTTCEAALEQGKEEQGNCYND